MCRLSPNELFCVRAGPAVGILQARLFIRPRLNALIGPLVFLFSWCPETAAITGLFAVAPLRTTTHHEFNYLLFRSAGAAHGCGNGVSMIGVTILEVPSKGSQAFEGEPA